MSGNWEQYWLFGVFLEDWKFGTFLTVMNSASTLECNWIFVLYVSTNSNIPGDRREGIYPRFSCMWQKATKMGGRRSLEILHSCIISS